MAGDEVAAWIFCVILESTRGCFHYVGHMSGDVILDSNRQQYVGAAYLSNNAAEYSALAHALLWVMQQGLRETPVTFHGDNELAGGVSTGVYAARCHPIVAELL